MSSKNLQSGITRRNFLKSSSAALGVLAAGTFAEEMEGATMKRSEKRYCGLFAFDPTVDPAKFASSCREWGIRQAILPPSFFATDRFEKALAREGIGLWLNIPVFYNPAYLERHPEHYAITSQGRRAIHDWCHFVCPNRPEYQDKLLSEVRGLLSRLRPEVVSLDFIRHYVFWEAVELRGSSAGIEDGCYCPVCLAEFGKASGVKVPAKQSATFIRANCKREWGDWKCGQISAMAERVIAEFRALAPQAHRSLKTVPWRESDLDGAIRHVAGQDIPTLSRNLDSVCPMAFVQILGQTPQWKRELLNHVRKTTGKPVCSYLQTDKVIRPEEISIAQFEAEMGEAFSEEWAGTAVFEYAQLAANPEKAALLRKRLNP